MKLNEKKVLLDNIKILLIKFVLTSILYINYLLINLSNKPSLLFSCMTKEIK